jgi:hypothetical protein
MHATCRAGAQAPGVEPGPEGPDPFPDLASPVVALGPALVPEALPAPTDPVAKAVLRFRVTARGSSSSGRPSQKVNRGMYVVNVLYLSAYTRTVKGKWGGGEAS